MREWRIEVTDSVILYRSQINDFVLQISKYCAVILQLEHILSVIADEKEFRTVLVDC